MLSMTYCVAYIVVISILIIFQLSIVGFVVPPDACFENFRFDDCGQPPQAVTYYWKPGSRCEVGMWRGCLPNPNMFHDEYECINTCIFVARAQPEDYHEHLKHEEYPEDATVTAEVTDYGNPTDVTESSANGTSFGNETTLSTSLVTTSNETTTIEETTPTSNLSTTTEVVPSTESTTVKKQAR